MAIYTLGFASRTEQNVREILCEYNVGRFVDLRDDNSLRETQRFERKALEKMLENDNIEYFYVGDMLPKESGNKKEFYEALKRLEKIVCGISKNNILLGSDGFFWNAPVKPLSNELSRKGYPVRHIFEKGRVYNHT